MSSKLPTAFRERAVVSSFICTSPSSPQGLQFALFKRSKDVRTYQGKWAVCSGSIETTDTSPEAAAKREISEETTLSDDDISLLSKGKPFSLTDDQLKTRWTIHPFAWELKEGAKPIKFDWEHTEYRFIRPEELVKFDHVPQLEVGMHRALVSLETSDDLVHLRSTPDQTTTSLFNETCRLLLRSASAGDLSKASVSTELWRELRWKAWHFVENGDVESEAKDGLKTALGSMLSSIMTAVKCSCTAEIEKLPLPMFQQAVRAAVENNLPVDVAVVVEKDGAWESIIEDL